MGMHKQIFAIRNFKLQCSDLRSGSCNKQCQKGEAKKCMCWLVPKFNAHVNLSYIVANLQTKMLASLATGNFLILSKLALLNSECHS